MTVRMILDGTDKMGGIRTIWPIRTVVRVNVGDTGVQMAKANINTGSKDFAETSSQVHLGGLHLKMAKLGSLKSGPRILGPT